MSRPTDIDSFPTPAAVDPRRPHGAGGPVLLTEHDGSLLFHACEVGLLEGLEGLQRAGARDPARRLAGVIRALRDAHTSATAHRETPPDLETAGQTSGVRAGDRPSPESRPARHGSPHDGFTIAEAAGELLLSESQVRKLASAGNLPGSEKRGRDWWIPRAGLEEFQRQRAA